MKKILLLLLLTLPLLMLGQEAEPIEGLEIEVQASSDTIYSSGMTGVLGSVTADGVVYTQIRLMPEFRIWKFWIGLDLDFLLDAEGSLRAEDWDEWGDLLHKIYYLRFANRTDPFYFKAINIDDYSLGHGLMMKSYSNTLRYPTERSIGGFVGINTDMMGLGVEAFTHDIARNEILAGRIQLKPLSPSRIPVLKTLTIGANVALDRNQLGKYKDSDGDGIPDIYDSFPNDPRYGADTDGDGVPDAIDIDIDGDNNLDSPLVNPFVDLVYPGIGGYGWNLDTDVISDSLATYRANHPLRIYSLDYTLSLVDSEQLKLYNYGEVAQIEGFGRGLVFPGFGAQFWILNANLEMRRFSDRFLPAYFDNLYDEQRSYHYIRVDPVTGQKLYYLETKDQSLQDVKAAVGWYGSISARIKHYAKFSASYQDMYGEQLRTGKTLTGELSIYPNFIKNLEEASLSYAQKHQDHISFLKLRTPGAELRGKLVYRIASNANLAGAYSEHYVDVNNDGVISLKEEVIKKLSFGVEFVF